MHLRQPLRALAVLPLAALALAAPAAAATKPADAPLGFSIAPVGQSKAHFELEGRAGQTVDGAVAIRNRTSKPLTVVLRRQSAGTAATGGLQYDDPKPGEAGRWLKLERPSVSLAPGAVREVRFSARIPADARAGDHFGGIVAYDSADLERVRRGQRSGGVRLNFVSRFAIAVQYRVAGPATPAISLGGVRIDTAPSGASVIVELDNTGQLLVPSTRGRITVTRGEDTLVGHQVEIGSFIPDSSIGYVIPWQGTPAEGTYRVRGFLHPENAPAIEIDEEVTFGRGDTQALAERSGQQAVRAGLPWWAWLAPVLLAAAGIALLVRVHRRRRRPVARRTAVPVAAPPAFVATVVDLNSATEAQLAQLPRVGPAAARRVIEHRDEYGRFESVDDLLQVDGFDAERVALVAERVVAR